MEFVASIFRQELPSEYLIATFRFDTVLSRRELAHYSSDNLNSRNMFSDWFFEVTHGSLGMPVCHLRTGGVCRTWCKDGEAAQVALSTLHSNVACWLEPQLKQNFLFWVTVLTEAATTANGCSCSILSQSSALGGRRQHA